MLPTLLFWLALLLPGWLLLKRFAPEALKTGMPGSLALSWLATFTLLSPVSIACYLLRLPVGCFAVCCAGLVAGSLWLIARRGWWRELADLALKGACLELALLGVDLVLGARIGSFVGGGDELFHVARVRFLLDHGFSNLEPSIAGSSFLAPYHTNLLHALLAAAVRILPTDLLGVWSGSLVFAKLAAAGGLHALGRALFDRPWIAWLFMLPVFLQSVSIDYLTYPNQLAPLWVLPLVLAFAARALDGANTVRAAIALAAGSLVLGQLHALYAAHAGLLLAPLFLGLLAFRAWKRTPGWWRTAFLLLALGAGAPFVLGASERVGRGNLGRTEDDGGGESRSTALATKAETHGFHFEAGHVGAALFERTLDGRIANWLLLSAGVVAAVASRRRREALAVIVPLAVVLVVLFVAPVTTALVDRVGLLSVARLRAHLELGFGLLPAAAALLLEAWFARVSLARRWLRDPAVRALTSLGLAVATLAIFPGKAPWNLATYWQRASSPAAARDAKLVRLREDQAFFAESLPRDATVLADFRDGQTLVMLWDVRVVIGRSSVSDAPQRRSDLARLTSPSLPWEERRELLRRHGIRHALVSTRTQAQWDWLDGHVSGQRMSPDKSWVVLGINVE